VANKNASIFGAHECIGER